MRPTIKYNPPWRIVLLRHLKPGETLASIYRLLGWTNSRVYWLGRAGQDLRLSEAYRMAQAVGAPIGPFLMELAQATGVTPLEGNALPPRPSRVHRGKPCSFCRKWGHKRKDCPTLHAQSEMRSMLARGLAHARSGRQIRGHR